MSATVERRVRKTTTTWRVVVYKAGKRRRFTFQTEREARATAAAINRLDKAADGWLQDDGILMSRDVLLGWLERYRGRLSQSYEVTAAGLVEQYLIPHFGCIPLAEITSDHLYAFTVKVYEAGKSGALALNALSILRRACQLYVEAGLLSANPAARCGAIVKQVGRRHESEVKRASAWTRAEVGTLLALAKVHERHVYGPLLCALHTGMRRGEILGLEWRDVGPRTIAVERAWVRGASRLPKSGKPRDIPISGPLRALLDGLRPKAAATFGDLGPVFLNGSGARWEEANFGRSWRRLQKLAVKAGVRPLRFHDARHTFASWALESGKSIKWVQSMLGHSSPELTLRTYSHLMKSEGDEMGWLEAPAVKPAREA